MEIMSLSPEDTKYIQDRIKDQSSVIQPDRTIGKLLSIIEKLREQNDLLLNALPADDIEGATLEWYAAKFEYTLGHPKFGKRLRNYAAIARGWRPDGEPNDNRAS